jgi:hypothetical protein
LPPGFLDPHADRDLGRIDRCGHRLAGSVTDAANRPAPGQISPHVSRACQHVRTDSTTQATTLTDDDALGAVLTAELVKHRMAKEAEKAKAAAAER